MLTNNITRKCQNNKKLRPAGPNDGNIVIFKQLILRPIAQEILWDWEACCFHEKTNADDQDLLLLHHSSFLPQRVKK